MIWGVPRDAVLVGEGGDSQDRAFTDRGGYVTGFDPAALPERDALRHELGYREDEKVCVVSVGGPIAMAYIRRDLGEPGTALAVDVRTEYSSAVQYQ